ncbi:hypothetical protein EW026_g6943 [Hermanssonia centrifuga]|uniref:RRM domain-containing protein n=1 Tax=Hermanssonia centrifuga TaxID=98765 RepID=A0A4S4KAE4_9APHY|nr:hypothetical protein EW026_g6943 [Hermanssonia centrifuga]
MAGIFQDSSRPSTSVPTSPPPPGTQFSRPGSRPTPTSVGIPGGLTNDDIEARIQAAMSTASASGSRSPTNPPRDTRTQLFVGNLPYRVRWQDLKDLFRRAGTVLRADVSLGPDNRSRGYGTVLLASAEDAGRAVDMFNGYVWQTRTLEVRPDRLGVAAGSIGGLGGLGAGVGLGGVGGLGVGTLANLGGLGGVGLAGGLGQLAAGGLDEYGLASLAAGVGGGNIANKMSSSPEKDQVLAAEKTLVVVEG